MIDSARLRFSNQKFTANSCRIMCDDTGFASLVREPDVVRLVFRHARKQMILLRFSVRKLLRIGRHESNRNLNYLT